MDRTTASKLNIAGRQVSALAVCAAGIAAAVGAASATAAAPSERSVAFAPEAAYAEAALAPTFEDFESADVSNESRKECEGPLTSGVASDCFPDGDLKPGVLYSVKNGDGTSAGLSVFGETDGGIFNTKLLSNFTVENTARSSLVVDFTKPVDTAQFNVMHINGGEGDELECRGIVEYADNGPQGSFVEPCIKFSKSNPASVKVAGSRLIDKMFIFIDGPEEIGIDNLSFDRVNGSASNVVTDIGVERQRKLGTATMTLTVPGPGKIKLSGEQVVAVERAPGAKKTVKIPIEAKGAAKVRLNRRGRVLVDVAVRFSPTGGTPRTINRTVKLLKSS